MNKAKIDVAIALLFHHGQVLVGWREAKQHQGNKYEFPGGKVEQGELPVDACRREIQEEVGIDIKDWHPTLHICHDYDDLVVSLHVFHAVVNSAQIKDIQAPWVWYKRDVLSNLNFPKANDVLITQLDWQHQIKISSELHDLSCLSHDYLMYWRVEPTKIHVQALDTLATSDLRQLIVNIELWQGMDIEKRQNIGAIHLKQQQLMHLKKGDLISGVRYIAACHGLASAQHAQAIGCHAIFLSPILPTTTHSDAQPLGWDCLQAVAEQIHIPIFALGGMQKQNLVQAQQYGAYGIAGIRFL